MAVKHTVDDFGRYDGRTPREAVPLVVDEVVAALDPVEILLFGSVAQGEDNNPQNGRHRPVLSCISAPLARSRPS